MRTLSRNLSAALSGLLLLCAGCASDRQVISQANDFHGELQPAVINDPELTAYIQQLGARIIAAARRLDAKDYGPEEHRSEDAKWMFSKDMKFHFVNSKTLNAFTTGGNHMYIYTGLFRQARSEDELAAVMAHEFAHVYDRHVHKGMNRQYAILGAAAAAGAGGYVAGGQEKGAQYAGMAAGAAALVGQFVGMSYTRSDETAADAGGFDFYVRGGWDPAHFGDFFQQMIEKGYDKGPEMLSDHPSLSSRLDTAHQRAAQLPPNSKRWRKPPVADGTRLAQLQARADAVGASMPTDESLAQTQKILAAMNRSCLTPAVQADQKQAEQEVLVAAERAKQK